MLLPTPNASINYSCSHICRRFQKFSLCAVVCDKHPKLVGSGRDDAIICHFAPPSSNASLVLVNLLPVAMQPQYFIHVDPLHSQWCLASVPANIVNKLFLLFRYYESVVDHDKAIDKASIKSQEGPIKIW